MKALHFLLLLFLVVCIGCESDSEPANIPPLIPLKEGNWWLYEMSTFDSTGQLVDRHYDTVHVGSSAPIDGEEFHWILNHYSGLVNDSTMQTNRTDGVWENDFYHFFPVMLYKYPTQQNDTFRIEQTVSPGWDDVVERSFTITVALQDSVTIPLGTFSTTHYRAHRQQIDSLTDQVLDEFNIDHYVAPGIGLVKKVTPIIRTVGLPDTMIFERQTQESVLKAYDLK